MNDDNDIYKQGGKLMLKIENLSEFAREGANSRRLSDAVHIRGLPWKILASISRENCLNYYVQCDAGNAGANWSCIASATLRITAQKEEKKDLMLKYTRKFCAKSNEWGYPNLMPFELLMDPENGWYNVENDTVILSVDVTAYAPLGFKTNASLADRMMYLLKSGKDANVHFLVGTEEGQKEQFSAHKGILATISSVFDRMFDIDAIRGNSDKVIEVTDVKPEAFRVMLKFIYTTKLDGLNQQKVFDVIHAANKYDIAELIDACADADCPKLDIDNVLYALGKASLYDVKGLVDRCWEFIDRNACAVLENGKFVEIDQTLLCDLFARDQLVLYDREIAIWNAALRWADTQCHKRDMAFTGENRRKVLGPVLFKIRFPLIPKDQFISSIVPTNVLTNEEKVSVFLYHAHLLTKDIESGPPLAFSDGVRAHK